MITLTPEQSHYVLQTLLSRRRVGAAEVAKALRSRDQEIRELKERLASLESLAASTGSAGSSRRKAPSARRRISPRVRALRRRQGRYMGFVRRLKPAQKARVRALREKKGIEAAIRLASSLARK